MEDMRSLQACVLHRERRIDEEELDCTRMLLQMQDKEQPETEEKSFTEVHLTCGV